MGIALVAACSTAARADTDDDRWIEHCISDSANEGQSPQTLAV